MKSARATALTSLAAAAAAAAVASSTVARLDRKRALQTVLPALPDVVVRERVIATDDGGEIHIREAGAPDAPPLVLLHGVTLGGRVWQRQLATLSDTFRVIAPDWRGHGQSQAGEAGYHLSLLAADLATLLETLDLRRAVLVGHSMGGMAVLELARLHPDVVHERCAKQLLLSTTPRLQLAALARVSFGALGLAADRLPRRVPGDLGYALYRLAFGRHPDARAVELSRDLPAEMAPGAQGRSWAALGALDLRRVLPSIDVPTLVVVGSHDRITPERQSREMANAIPGAQFVVIEQCGHLVMLERPEAFEQVLRDFVAESERT